MPGRGQVGTGVYGEAAGLLGTLPGQQWHVAANTGSQETTGRHRRAALPSCSDVTGTLGDVPLLPGGALEQLRKGCILL